MKYFSSRRRAFGILAWSSLAILPLASACSGTDQLTGPGGSGGDIGVGGLSATGTAASVGRAAASGGSQAAGGAVMTGGSNADGWTTMSNNTLANVRFFEYKSTGAGANPTNATRANRQLSDAQAANYTVKNVLNPWVPGYSQ